MIELQNIHSQTYTKNVFAGCKHFLFLTDAVVRLVENKFRKVLHALSYCNINTFDQTIT